MRYQTCSMSTCTSSSVSSCYAYAVWTAVSTCILTVKLSCRFDMFMLCTLNAMWYLFYMCRDWCVGSVLDETCSEMWHALWIVRFRESIDLRTHTVMFGHTRHMYASVLIAVINICGMHIALCVSMWCRTSAQRYWHIWLRACQYMNNKLVAIVCFTPVSRPHLRSQRLCKQFSAKLDMFCMCDRNCERSNRVRFLHEAMLAHPPNLSILVSGGEHTTLYVFSHCERTRIISQFQSFACALNCCTQLYCHFGCGCNLLATPIHWGWQPRMEPAHIYLRLTQCD